MEHQTIARLVVRESRLVASDPLVPLYRAPFALDVAHGDHPVTVVLAKLPDQERVAYAYVRMRETAPERWEAAPTLGFDPTALGILAAPGYGVDSGTSCFMDLAAARRLFTAMDGDDGDTVGREIVDQMRSHERPGWSWASVVLDPSTGSNVVAFSSGMGDGFYSSFCAYDTEGELVCIVTDFQCEDWGLAVTATRTAAKTSPRKRWWSFLRRS